MKTSDRIKILQGDITAENVDAIVNAANTDLLLGGGVAGAIRSKGGAHIQAECDRHGPVALGGAALTGAGKLPARHVIHAAVMHLGDGPNEKSIRDATRNSLQIATDNGFDVISFPALGTGIGGFPKEEAAKIMISETLEHLRDHAKPFQVRFVLFDEHTYLTFMETVERKASD